jgi:hypothetical protein
MASENKKDFLQIIKNAGAAVIFKASEAIQWYKKRIQNSISSVKTNDTSKMFDKVGYPEIGKMYIFLYSAKHKDILPFYDAHPLVFPIEMYTDGFLGINLHYLPPSHRANLLTALYSLRVNDKYNNVAKLNISYNLLKAYSTQFSGFENCVKRYLFSHVKSKFSVVDPFDWEKVCMLPLQNWKINPNTKYSKPLPY